MAYQQKPSIAPKGDVTARGASGKSYNFFIHPIGTSYKTLPGIYIFCASNGQGGWKAIYVGQTHDFSGRVSKDTVTAHHRWEAVRRAGATHILSLVVDGGEKARLEIETDLIHGLNPPCNRQ